MEYVIQEEARKVMERELQKARQQRQKQVREQSIQWSENTRRKFDKEKENQIKRMTESITREAEEHAQARIEHLLMTHDLAMAEVGGAHRAAAQLREAEKAKELKRLQNNELAKQRGKAAIGKTRLEEETRSQALIQAQKRKEEVRKEEDRKVKEMIQQRKPLSALSSNVGLQDKSKTAVGVKKSYEQSAAARLRVFPKPSVKDRVLSKTPTKQGATVSKPASKVIHGGRFGQEAKLRVSPISSPSEDDVSETVLESRDFPTNTARRVSHGPPTKAPKTTKGKTVIPLSKPATVKYFDSSIPKPEAEYLPPKGLGEKHVSRGSPNAWEQGRLISQQAMKELEEKAKQQEELLRKASLRGQKASKKARLEKKLAAATSELMADYESFDRLGSGQQTALLGLDDSSEGEKKDTKRTRKTTPPDFSDRESEDFLEMTSDGEFDSTPEDQTLKKFRVEDSRKKIPGVTLHEIPSVSQKKETQSKSSVKEILENIDSKILELQMEVEEQELKRALALQTGKSHTKSSASGRKQEKTADRKGKKAKKKHIPDHDSVDRTSSGEIPTVISRKQYAVKPKKGGKVAEDDDDFMEMSSDGEFDFPPETVSLPGRDATKYEKNGLKGSNESQKLKKIDTTDFPQTKSKKIAEDAIGFIDTELSKLQKQQLPPSVDKELDTGNRQSSASSRVKTPEMQKIAALSTDKEKPSERKKIAADVVKPPEIKITADRVFDSSKTKSQSLPADMTKISSGSTLAEARMRTRIHSKDTLESSNGYTSASVSATKGKAQPQKKLTKKLPKKTTVETDTSKSEISSNSVVVPHTPEGPYTSTPDGKMKLKPSSGEVRRHRTRQEVLHQIVSEFIIRRRESIDELPVSSPSSSELKIDSGAASRTPSSSNFSSLLSSTNGQKSVAGSNSETWETILEERTIIEESITEESRIRVVSSGSTIAETKIKAFSPSSSTGASDNLPEDEVNGTQLSMEASLMRKLGALNENQELNVMLRNLKEELKRGASEHGENTSPSITTGSSDPTGETTDFNHEVYSEVQELSSLLNSMSEHESSGSQNPTGDNTDRSSSKTASGEEKEAKRINEFISDLSELSGLWKLSPIRETVNHEEMIADIFEQLKNEYASMSIARPPTAP